MHKKNDISWQCDLLALNAILEAARSGESGLDFAHQAEVLRGLSLKSDARDSASLSPRQRENLLSEIDSRIAKLKSEQNEISLLAAEINAKAQRETDALQFEDVVSQVVVYSSAQSNRLRATAAQIELQHGLLEAEMERDRGEIDELAESVRRDLLKTTEK